jgi:ABC-type multidrug transport system permease subunit
MVSVLVPDPMTGQTAGSGIFSAMMLFSGIFISRNDIPDYWIWLHYLSLFKYSFDSMFVNCFADISTPTMTNEEVLKYYGMDGTDRGTGIGVLWLFIIFFRLVFYYRLVTYFDGSRKK